MLLFLIKEGDVLVGRISSDSILECDCTSRASFFDNTLLSTDGETTSRLGLVDVTSDDLEFTIPALPCSR